MTQVKTITTAEPSVGDVRPLKRHLVDKGDALRGVPAREWGVPGTENVQPQQRTLCGELWDRLGLKPNGPVCERCVAEFRRRHPNWTVPQEWLA